MKRRYRDEAKTMDLSMEVGISVAGVGRDFRADWTGRIILHNIIIQERNRTTRERQIMIAEDGVWVES